MSRSPFHVGEVAMQRAAGSELRMRAIGLRVIRGHLPDQHREFVEQLPTLLVGSVDALQRPWASMLTGWPGFITAPDAQHLRVAALPMKEDPLHARLRIGGALGLLGIEPHTRRRNRVNGQVVALGDHGFELHVDQSFGNCPKYIQARTLRWAGEASQRLPVRHEGARLPEAAAALVAQADTLFVASTVPGEGVDVSHRGGRPGFVRVEQTAFGTMLALPDFIGKFFFNTLGNIAAHPKSGLLFIDHETGGVLQLTGRAAIVKSGAEVEAISGVQRLLRIEIEAGLWSPGTLPLRWSAPTFSPQFEAAGQGQPGYSRT